MSIEQAIITIPANISEAEICDKLYNNSHGNSDLLVVPRREYYDNRKAWKPGKGNVIVVLTETIDLALGTFVACEINGHYTPAVDDVRENTKWIRSHHKEFTYSLVFVFCLFVPQESIQNGTIVKLIHKNKKESCYSRVECESTLVVKPEFTVHRRSMARRPNSVLVCVAVFHRPLYLDAWLKYQKHLGVDMVHINADSSFIPNAVHYPNLKEAIASGFVVIDVWKSYLGEKMFYHSQLIKNQDCVMKYMGEFQYAFMLDTDDFFNPVLPFHKDIHYYVGQYFKNTQIATKHIKWVSYCKYPDLSKVPSNGNLTVLVEDGKTRPMWPGKTVHKLDKVLHVAVHKSETRVKGYYVNSWYSPIAYISHIRPQKTC